MRDAVAQPRFCDLRWQTDPRGVGYCECTRARFPNGWGAFFLRGEGTNASIYMDRNKIYYAGEYEILPVDPAGHGPEHGPLADGPFHGDAAEMQRLMDLIAEQSGESDA